MAQVCKFSKKGNIKLGKAMGSFSKLYGNGFYTVDGVGVVQGSCGDFCQGCLDSCYVKYSYRHPSVIKGHARNTQALRDDLKKAFDDLKGEYDRMRKKPLQFRIHQSGEIESTEELVAWYDYARERKGTTFFIYTKNFDALRESLQVSTIPKNFIVNISIWHEYGLKEFEEFRYHPQIKAFVYLDGYDYPFEISHLCKAYDENGKLDHSITCDKCQKCFNKRLKIVGCYDH